MKSLKNKRITSLFLAFAFVVMTVLSSSKPALAASFTYTQEGTLYQNGKVLVKTNLPITSVSTDGYSIAVKKSSNSFTVEAYNKITTTNINVVTSSGTYQVLVSIKKAPSIDTIVPKADATSRAVFKKYWSLGIDRTINGYTNGVVNDRFYPFDMKFCWKVDSATVNGLKNFGKFVYTVGIDNRYGGTNGASVKSKCQAAFSAEKAKYTGSDKAVVTGSILEYYARMYYMYCNNQANLKTTYPKTFAAINALIGNLEASSAALNQYRLPVQFN